MFKSFRKMRSKIIFRVSAVFFLCVFLPIMLFLWIGFLRVDDIIKVDNATTVSKSLLQLEQDFKKQIYHYDDVIDEIAKSADIKAYIENPDDMHLELEVQRYIDEFTESDGGVYKDITFYLFPDGEYRLESFQNVSAVENEKWYIDFFASNIAENWYSEYATDNPVLIKVMRVYNDEQVPLGIITVTTDLGRITNQAVYSLNEKKNIFVTTTEGKAVYFDKTSKCFADFSRDCPDEFANAIRSVQEGIQFSGDFKNSTVMMKLLQEYRIVLGSSIAVNAQPESFKALKMGVVFTVIILIIFIAIFYYYIIKIFATLRRDIALVEDYVENNPSGRLAVKYNDEIGDIERQYNILLGKIEKLTKNIVLKERLRKNAEISMLQSQLNPHFIYNVINHFRMQAEINEDYEMADSIAKFGKLMRYNMMNREYMITLKEEITNLKYFLELEMLRFSNQLEYEINCETGVDSAKVPKCILQPIIENSVKYGKRQGAKLHITVNIKAAKGDIYISVRDNGRGVNKNTLQSLNAQFCSGYYMSGAETEISTKIGLKNINQRIRLIYDDEYHISVDSKESEYFEVNIRIPAEW